MFCHPFLRESESRLKMFDSRRGELTIARISPLRGSSATTAPLSESGKASSAVFCSSRSMLSTREFPETASALGMLFSSPILRPKASTSTYCTPSFPRSQCS